MSEPASDKSRHVPVDVSEARIARLWGGVSAKLERPRSNARWFVVTAAACVVLAAGTGVHLYRAHGAAEASVWEGARLETAADRMSVSLVDGSKLTLDPNSRVAVQDRSASAVKLVLERGRLSCDVTHVPGRSFVVVTHGVEVRVVGTLFSVTSEQADGAERVEVRVERGVVEVRGPEGSQPTRVEAGHNWSQLTRTEASASPAPSSAPAAPSSAESAEKPPDSAPPPRAPRASSATSDTRPANARELFEQASGLWREGRAAEAAQAYQSFLSTYPRDARAGLAAFELGRLRMDRLGDAAGALKALERAMVLAPGSGFREDALARIVSASSSLGQLGRCSSAREQYLREYPNGVHRLRVSKACGGH